MPDRIPEHGLRTMPGCSVLTTKLLSFSLAVMAWRSEEEMGMEKSNAPIPEDRTDAPRIVDLRGVPLARLGADDDARDLLNLAMAGEHALSLVVVAGFQSAVS